MNLQINEMVNTIHDLEKKNKKLKLQLENTMIILERIFYLKVSGSEQTIENEGDKGWYYVSPKIGNELKKQLTKWLIEKY